MNAIRTLARWAVVAVVAIVGWTFSPDAATTRSREATTAVDKNNNNPCAHWTSHHHEDRRSPNVGLDAHEALPLHQRPIGATAYREPASPARNWTYDPAASLARPARLATTLHPPGTGVRALSPTAGYFDETHERIHAGPGWVGPRQSRVGVGTCGDQGLAVTAITMEFTHYDAVIKSCDEGLPLASPTGEPAPARGPPACVVPANTDSSVSSPAGRVAAKAAPQKLTNKAIGDAAADAIASQYPGALREVTLQAARGTRRLDVLTPQGLAIESKVGRTSLTKATRQQIQRDVELMNDPLSGVSSVEWHFGTSPITGLGGPTGPLEAALRTAGIGIR